MSLHRTIRRTLLAAALPAVLAAGLPSGAHAATAGIDQHGFMRYTASPGERNVLSIRAEGSALVFDDQVGIVPGTGCTGLGNGDVSCQAGTAPLLVHLGDRDDEVEHRAPRQAAILGEAGNDVFRAGVASAPRGTDQPVHYRGGPGNDTVSYLFADAGVRVDPVDQTIPDGRPGDQEHVSDGIETLEGSNFDDVLRGGPGDERLRGLHGDDELRGGAGDDLFDEGPTANGADTIDGGSGVDHLTYGARVSGVTVVLDGQRNDGAEGERDLVRPGVDVVWGTKHDDVLLGDERPNRFSGLGGDDVLDGRGGPDTLDAGTGQNRITGGTGNDVLLTTNRAADALDCGAGLDTAIADATETQVTACEDGDLGRGSVTTRPPSTGRSKAVDVRWEHPEAWQRLRSVEVHAMDAGRPVGVVRIHAASGRVTTAGSLRLSRPVTATREGRVVRARLPLVATDDRARGRLRAELHVVGVDGRRHVVPAAGLIIG